MNENNRQVLILEDHTIVAQGMRKILEKAGCSVQITHDGKDFLVQAQAHIAAGRWFIGLLDLHIDNGMGGLEVARQMSPQTCRLIAVSGETDDPIFQEPQLHGFSAALGKPFTPAELLAAIKKF